MGQSQLELELVTHVLSETSIGAIGPMLAAVLRDDIAAGDRDHDAGGGDGSAGAVRTTRRDELAVQRGYLRPGGCFPEREGVQCVWGTVVESEPEGLHQCSAQMQIDLRWSALTFAVHRRACKGGAGAGDAEGAHEAHGGWLW